MDAQYTGNQISQLRKQLSLTQRELAEKLHVTDKAVSKWERGINFPDLGLMEALAEALETTPAVLLGLENADQTETLTALTEISREQLEEARSDLRIFSWGSIVVALLLVLAYHLTLKRAVEVYYLLHSLILVIGVVGLVYLFKYEQIKKWEVPELGSFFGTVLPVLIWNVWTFFTGYSPSPIVTGILIAVASVFAQVHFLQIMKPRFMQLLPLSFSTLFLLWNLLLGGVTVLEAIPAACAWIVWLCHVFRHPGYWRIKWKTIGNTLVLVTALVAILCLLLQPALIRIYVKANQTELRDYAENMLESEESGTYGPWEVTAYPELGIVQFHTGGSGFGSETNYEGFYYSASGDHTGFPGFDGETYQIGDDAWFYNAVEASDNLETSTQFAPYWFWYQLHY